MTNEDSPFRSPSLESTQPPVDEEARLLSIVKYQRLLAIAALLYAGFVTFLQAAAFLGHPITHENFWLPATLYWIVAYVCMFLVFQLARRVYSIPIALLYSALTLFWILGLGILVIVNQKAVRVLKEHGLRPGFLGMSRRAAIAQLNEAKANESTRKPAAPSIPQIDRLQ